MKLRVGHLTNISYLHIVQCPNFDLPTRMMASMSNSIAMTRGTENARLNMLPLGYIFHSFIYLRIIASVRPYSGQRRVVDCPFDS